MDAPAMRRTVRRLTKQDAFVTVAEVLGKARLGTARERVSAEG
jgi:hypothetical protein